MPFRPFKMQICSECSELTLQISNKQKKKKSANIFKKWTPI